ncbi:enoyl-CoA hydratase [Comamonas serinivorans]|uniref:Enoyl-CoA hydratase n=1 Tax=Comamonas serinivorans TaxID=1082851 RepID=A0A1Y0EMM3_9BURK|nr:crotonase/enoyl-CoA hydratase family protein [Comamonas serinivorans]ARU04837.1 enoyl-CoA hydratase [Comamonas serinivorans]
MTAPVLVEIKDNVQIITLNRPEAKNAATAEMAELMVQAIDQLESRDDLSVGIITGAGGTFCAGMDLKDFLKGRRPSIPGRGFLGLSERAPRKVMIAAVEGYALAGGFETVLACDLIVASSAAKFGLPEVKRGLVAAAGGVMRLPRRMPYHLAMEYILTGDFISADVAKANGLVNRMTEPGKALEEALKLAEAVAANGPLALAASKRVVYESSGWTLDEMFAKQGEIIAPVFGSADAKEGAAAFAEKRKPVWQGK